MSNWIIALHLCIVVLVSFTSVSFAQEPADSQELWCGSYADGTPLCYDELMELIEKHQRWLERDEVGRQEHIEERLDLGSDYDELRYFIDRMQNGEEYVKSRAIGADLSGVYLEGCDLEGARISYCNLSRSSLDDVNLSNSYMYAVDWSESRLCNINYSGSYLYFSLYVKSNILHCDFSYGHLGCVDFSEAIILSSYFTNSSVVTSSFLETKMFDVDFSGADVALTCPPKTAPFIL